jgi:hypothetical protein
MYRLSVPWSNTTTFCRICISGGFKINSVMECALNKQKNPLLLVQGVFCLRCCVNGEQKSTPQTLGYVLHEVCCSNSPPFSHPTARQWLFPSLTLSLSPLSLCSREGLPLLAIVWWREDRAKSFVTKKNDTIHFVVHITWFPSLNLNRPDSYLAFQKVSVVQHIHHTILLFILLFLGNTVLLYTSFTSPSLHPIFIRHTDKKKKIKFSSYIRKFRVEQLQSHNMSNGLLIYGEIFAYFLIY